MRVEHPACRCKWRERSRHCPIAVVELAISPPLEEVAASHEANYRRGSVSRLASRPSDSLSLWISSPVSSAISWPSPRNRTSAALRLASTSPSRRSATRSTSSSRPWARAVRAHEPRGQADRRRPRRSSKRRRSRSRRSTAPPSAPALPAQGSPAPCAWVRPTGQFRDSGTILASVEHDNPNMTVIPSDCSVPIPGRVLGGELDIGLALHPEPMTGILSEAAPRRAGRRAGRQTPPPRPGEVHPIGRPRARDGASVPSRASSDLLRPHHGLSSARASSPR